VNGVLVLDKPTRMSSAAAVDHVRKRLGVKRAGHGGTLDPIATGVLAICLGEATKLAGYLQADDKAYEAELVLGVETDTLDRTGQVTSTRDASGITREQIEAALLARMGEHDQLPPMFSAIKIDGRRLYHRARQGEEVERETRRVRLDQLELLDFTAGSPPRIRLAIACSKGTYVRSLIADLGTDLGCGAHMSELCRTRSGVFSIAQAHDLDRLDDCKLVSMEDATRLPRATVTAQLIAKVRNGLHMPPEMFAVAPEHYGRFLLVDEHGKLVALSHVEDGKTLYDRVFVYGREAT
jgi:tRNA pseudouridine55 synthase